MSCKNQRCLSLGTDVEVVRETPVVTRLEKDHPYPWVRITQKITLTVEVPLGLVKGRCCAFCGKVPPIPDEKGAEFILANSDGQRICFPEEETAKPERDAYPISGWRSLVVDDEAVLACGDCAADIASMIKNKHQEMKASRAKR